MSNDDLTQTSTATTTNNLIPVNIDREPIIFSDNDASLENGGTPRHRWSRGGCGGTPAASGGGEHAERVVSAVEAHAVHFLHLHGREKRLGSC